MWLEQWQQLRPAARDLAHGILFVLAVVLVVKGGLLTSPVDLGLIGVAMTLFAAVGIGRA